MSRATSSEDFPLAGYLWKLKSKQSFVGGGWNKR